MQLPHLQMCGWWQWPFVGRSTRGECGPLLHVDCTLSSFRVYSSVRLTTSCLRRPSTTQIKEFVLELVKLIYWNPFCAFKVARICENNLWACTCFIRSTSSPFWIDLVCNQSIWIDIIDFFLNDAVDGAGLASMLLSSVRSGRGDVLSGYATVGLRNGLPKQLWHSQELQQMGGTQL